MWNLCFKKSEYLLSVLVTLLLIVSPYFSKILIKFRCYFGFVSYIFVVKVK